MNAHLGAGWCALLVALVAAPARPGAQELTPADAIPLGGSALELAERALPPAGAAFSLEALSLARAGLPELGTRALAVRAGWRVWHAAAGIASSGDPEIGWNTAVVAIGIGGARAGGAPRTRAAALPGVPGGADAGEQRRAGGGGARPPRGDAGARDGDDGGDPRGGGRARRGAARTARALHCRAGSGTRSRATPGCSP